MNLIRNTHIAVLAAVVATGLTGTASAAPQTAGSMSAGPAKPTHKWTHAKWRQCWKLSYAQGREDGLTPNGATAYADLVCGDPPMD